MEHVHGRGLQSIHVLITTKGGEYRLTVLAVRTYFHNQRLLEQTVKGKLKGGLKSWRK